ncbi:MAG: alpha amylase N-terminal ig-like domain-containing protein [Sandaracinus sp.]|nr:alpha amylase N-terminal ig-like domain-containing protein [Sandaracinus sp.]
MPRVVLRHRPSRGTSFVELRGEVAAWDDPIVLRRVDDGAFEAELVVAPGVYRYKLVYDDRSWHRHAENPRVQVEDGNANSVLVVGGTAEPLLHAPVSPWLVACDDGRLIVRASLRRGHGDALVLRWNEGHASERAPMRVVGGTDSHLDFELAIPTSARRLDYLFELADGTLVGHGDAAFSIESRRLVRTTPEWWKDAVVYTVLLDRFAREGGFEGFVDARPMPERFAGDPRFEEQRRRGGDLRGVIERLDHLVALGVDVLHLTPPFVSPSSHRYDVSDFDRIDPALGGDEALRALLDAAHARGLRVLLDLPFTHVSRELGLFVDVRDRGLASPFASFFHVYAHPFTEGLEPGYRTYPKGAWREPLLNVDEPAVHDFAADVVRRWTRFGVDGFRLDAAAELPKPMLAAIVRGAREVNADALVFGEVVADHVAAFCEADGALLHAGTEMVGRERLLDFLRGTIDGEAFAHVDARLGFRRGEGHARLGFCTTHDHPRTLTTLRDAELARLAHLVVALRPEVPMWLYGEELGLGSAEERGYEDVWPDRMPMPWGEEALWDHATLTLSREVLALRRAHVVFRRGEHRPLVARESSGAALPEVLAFRRQHADTIVDVFVHRGEGEVRVVLPADAPSSASVLFAHGDARLDEHGAVLGGRAAIVLERRASVEAEATWRAIRDEGARLVEHAFVEGWDEVPSLPTRLYLTLTERCNLRCVHCITDAPRRTADGSARTMAPWVLDALREAFLGVSYVGFSHGGESLVHPDFFRFLRTIVDTRATRPGRLDVHLLSNGLRLTEPTIASLVDHGLTSLAISLDGATRETQETIRLGGRFDTVLTNVAHAVAARERGADLRVGISAVLTRRLVKELPALARRCVALGVQWLKIEETVGVSHAARLLLVDPSAPEVGDAMAEVHAILDAGGVTLVDHLHTPARCACVDPAARAFREADDFANRTRFRPCRMAWEQAVVDPDGTVRAIDYEHPAIGRLDEAPLLALWNAELPKSLRRAALRAYPRDARERCVARG